MLAPTEIIAVVVGRFVRCHRSVKRVSVRVRGVWVTVHAVGVRTYFMFGVVRMGSVVVRVVIAMVVSTRVSKGRVRMILVRIVRVVVGSVPLMSIFAIIVLIKVRTVRYPRHRAVLFVILGIVVMGGNVFPGIVV